MNNRFSQASAAACGQSSEPAAERNRRCFIVSAGTFSPIPCPEADDFIIACDRGYIYCERLGCKPDLLITDFDSYDGPVDAAVPLEEFPSEKDDTDTMLAIRFAVEHGFDEVLLTCALGGRLDHLFANLQSLVFARSQGLAASLISEDTEVFALQDESRSFPRKEGWSLSVFAVDGPCRGVSISGAKYPLDNAELQPSFPLGVSNQWAADEAAITVREGVLLVILSRM